MEPTLPPALGRHKGCTHVCEEAVGTLVTVG